MLISADLKQLSPMTQHASIRHRMRYFPIMKKMLKTLGIERMVLVQPSIYGENNSVMLKAMEETSLPARGVAVVPVDIDQLELEALHNKGIRGVRFNLVDVKKTQGRSILRQDYSPCQAYQTIGLAC